jgi:hypothetical protein
VSLPVAFLAITPGESGGITASGTGGIGFTSGNGFFVGMTVGGGFLGMLKSMPLLPLEIKPAAQVGYAVMPIGMYRRRHALLRSGSIAKRLRKSLRTSKLLIALSFGSVKI